MASIKKAKTNDNPYLKAKNKEKLTTTKKASYKNKKRKKKVYINTEAKVYNSK